MPTNEAEALEQIIRTLRERIQKLEVREHAEQTGRVDVVATVATLPVAGQQGRVRFVFDGRKVGEGAGAGTGVLVYDDGVAWRRTADDTTVVA
jgi:hypothetical protein